MNANRYTVGDHVTGLTGRGLVLQNKGSMATIGRSRAIAFARGIGRPVARI